MAISTGRRDIFSTFAVSLIVFNGSLSILVQQSTKHSISELYSFQQSFYILTLGRGAYDTVMPGWIEVIEGNLKKSTEVGWWLPIQLEAKVAAEPHHRNLWNPRYEFDGARASVAEQEAEEEEDNF